MLACERFARRHLSTAALCWTMTASATVMPTAAADDTSLATVGARSIVLSDLRAFEVTVGSAMWPDLAPTQRDSALLRTLIDKTVLLAEAEARDIESEAWFAPQLQAQVDVFVVKLYMTMEISQRVMIGKAEMEEHFRNTHRDRALRYAGILVDTEPEATALLALIADGADFAEVAREHSLFDKTRGRGGDMETYLLRDETDPPIQPIFELEVGAVSQPLAAPFLGGEKKYAIFKILDALPVGIESAIDVVKEEVFERKRTARTAVVVDSLTTVYQPQILQANIASVASRVEAEGLTEEIAAVPLITYEGGEFTVADLVNTTAQGEDDDPPGLSNMEWVEKMLKANVQSALFLAAAQTLGLQTDSRTAEWRQAKREDKLVSSLKRREVDDRIPETSDQEAKRFYDRHPEKFMTWAQVSVNEILVGEREHAEALRGELEAGADATELAAKHSTRVGLDHHEGLLVLNKGSQYRYGTALFETARELEVGDIGGPVVVDEGYSVFQVVSNEPAQVKPFEVNSQLRAKAYVRVGRFRRAFVEFVRILWEKHNVEVFADYM